jgi:hypothetical protein
MGLGHGIDRLVARIKSSGTETHREAGAFNIYIICISNHTRTHARTRNGATSGEGAVHPCAASWLARITACAFSANAAVSQAWPWTRPTPRLSRPSSRGRRRRR